MLGDSAANFYLTRCRHQLSLCWYLHELKVKYKMRKRRYAGFAWFKVGLVEENNGLAQVGSTLDHINDTLSADPRQFCRLGIIEEVIQVAQRLLQLCNSSLLHLIKSDSKAESGMTSSISLRWSPSDGAVVLDVEDPSPETGSAASETHSLEMAFYMLALSVHSSVHSTNIPNIHHLP